jgi:hypothetical protein
MKKIFLSLAVMALSLLFFVACHHHHIRHVRP